MKNTLENIVKALIGIFTIAGLISVFIGIMLADNTSLLPTAIFVGSGSATIGLCYLFGRAVFDE